jgi:hypothetical protein
LGHLSAGAVQLREKPAGTMKIHHLSVAEAFASVQSDPDGLAPAEAARRLAEFGLNQVEQLRRESLALLFLKGFTPDWPSSRNGASRAKGWGRWASPSLA